LTNEKTEDLKPRFGDIEIMKEGLEKPWLLPKLAEEYSKKHFGGKPLPPYDLLPSPLTERLLKSRWLRQKPHTLSRRALGLLYGPVSQQLPPDYQSPFEKPLTEILKPDSPDQRSVVFVHHSYYHFYYLAKALRERGWNAWCVSTEDPDSANACYYHGEDLNLWHESPVVARELQRELFDAVSEHFKMIHFHGDSKFAIFDELLCYNNERDGICWDFLELKARGVKIGHSMSGCLTGQRKSVFNEVTNGVCNKCVWQNNPNVCSDAAQLHSGRRIELLVDLNALEVDWPADFSRHTKNCFYDPLTYCFDEELWHPNIEIPDHIERFERSPGEVLVFHAVGNLEDRQSETRNIKGTPAILAAIERLQREGHPVKLIFKTGVPSKDMRFYQVQADIVVDQINYGRWGATARETMALGLPTICHVVREQPCGVKPSRALTECPLVDATEENIYDVLKDLVLRPDKRAKLCNESRAFAMKWHSSRACAERYERVYDRLIGGDFPLDVDEIYK